MRSSYVNNPNVNVWVLQPELIFYKTKTFKNPDMALSKFNSNQQKKVHFYIWPSVKMNNNSFAFQSKLIQSWSWSEFEDTKRIIKTKWFIWPKHHWISMFVDSKFRFCFLLNCVINLIFLSSNKFCFISQLLHIWRFLSSCAGYLVVLVVQQWPPNSQTTFKCVQKSTVCPSVLLSFHFQCILLGF